VGYENQLPTLKHLNQSILLDFSNLLNRLERRGPNVVRLPAFRASGGGQLLRRALCLVLAAGLVSPLGAEPDVPVFSSEVALVLLPVFVVGPGGVAARGLQAEDFELYEDGKRVEVAAFRYVDTTSPEEQDSIREAPAARRRFLLLFDQSFTDPNGLNRAQRAAADFVRSRMAASDLAAVATFDINRGTRLVANFTEDRALLVHAVETLGVSTMARISDPMALAQDMVALDTRTGRVGGEASGSVDAAGGQVVLMNQMRAAEVSSYRQGIEAFAAQMDDLARALRRVEGRKQVLFFSAGFDSRLLTGQTGEEQKMAAQSSVTGALWEIDGSTRFGDSRVREQVMDMTRQFTNADTVIHTIDVTGLGADDALGRMYTAVDLGRATVGRESLNLLAAETGGRFFKDANDLQPLLREMLDMTSRYYVLGFQPAKAKAPGAFHRVKVKVGRKGMKVSHRPGYYERELLTVRAPVLQRQFEAAELILGGEGSEAKNDLKMSSLCLPLPAAGDTQTVALVVQIGTEKLEWAAGRPTSLEMYAYAVGEDGTVLDHLARLARIDPSKRPPGDTRGVSFYGTFQVPPGTYTLRTMVVERETGATGVQVLEVKVPPFDPTAGFLLPPLVVEDAASWVSLDVARQDAGRSPFDVGGRQYVPRTSFEVKGGAAEKMVLVAFAPERPGDPSDIQIRSSLTSRDGKAAPAGVLRIDKMYRDPGGRRVFVLGYTPDQVAPGEYTLRVALGDGADRLESYALLRVRAGS
jgi:VWFA-related protein